VFQQAVSQRLVPTKMYTVEGRISFNDVGILSPLILVLLLGRDFRTHKVPQTASLNSAISGLEL